MKKVLEKELGIKGDYQYKALHSKNPIHANWHKNKFHALKAFIKDKYQKKALDVGAGAGVFEHLFGNNFSDITAVDYNDEAIEFINKQCVAAKLTNVKAVVLDLENIEDVGRDGKYDLIILLDVIEHLDVSTVDMLLLSFAKLLNDGGKVVVSTPNYGGVWNLTEKLVDMFGLVPHLDGAQHINKFDLPKLTACFEKSGFSLVRGTTVNTFSYLFPVDSVSQRLVDLEASLNLPFGNLLFAEFVPVRG